MKRSFKLALLLGFAFVAVSAAVQSTSGGARAAAPDGKAIFLAKCATCHQATGVGGGPFPPLAGNLDVTAPDTSALLSTVLNGRSGPIEVSGRTYGGAMPAWKGQLTNAEIAAVVTYIRSSWGNKAASVTEEQVAAAAKPMAYSGAQIFALRCAGCHQAHGQGTAVIPPLAGNPHVIAEDPEGMIATIVNGRSGPLTVAGKAYDGKMPTWKGQLSNPDIAAVATYIRSSWGNEASAVSELQVTAAGPAVVSAIGASIFNSKCASCHKANGQGGGGGMFPALAGNKTVTASDPSTIIATVEHGRNLMPSWKGQLTDADIAAVLTYVRNSWGNAAPAVDEAQVAAVK